MEILNKLIIDILKWVFIFTMFFLFIISFINLQGCTQFRIAPIWTMYDSEDVKLITVEDESEFE